MELQKELEDGQRERSPKKSKDIALSSFTDLDGCKTVQIADNDIEEYLKSEQKWDEQPRVIVVVHTPNQCILLFFLTKFSTLVCCRWDCQLCSSNEHPTYLLYWRWELSTASSCDVGTW